MVPSRVVWARATAGKSTTNPKRHSRSERITFSQPLKEYKLPEECPGDGRF